MFHDRRDAGRQLAAELNRTAGRHPVVVGLPRGGVVVAAEIAERLHAPLDLVVVRKLGVPWQPELAFGAIAEGGICFLNDALIDEAGIGEGAIQDVITRERAELERRVAIYRGDRRPATVSHREVIVVDDGLATGYTAHAAIECLRRRGASRVILAVPVAPDHGVPTMGHVADVFVALERPSWLVAIGAHYEDFRQTPDDEVLQLLRRAAERQRDEAVVGSLRE